jgi:hypothetical protein
MACAGPKGGDGDTANLGGGDLGLEPWSVVAEDVPGGVLLSAWSDGETLRMVGGDLGGGPGMMLHWDGETLCREPDVTDRALWWIHGHSAGEWFAVGENGTVLRSIDGTRSRIDVPTDATLFGVWASEEELWVAGGHVGGGLNDGEIWRWNGVHWDAIETGLPGVIFKVWDGWFVGQDVSYRWNGTTLEPMESAGRLLTVRGRGEDDVWAVGGLTGPLVVQHKDGAWVEQDTSGLDQPINGIWTDEGEDIWVAGNYGTMAHWDGTRWLRPSEPLTTDHLHAVWQHGEETWWLGGDLFSVGDNHGIVLRHGERALRPELVECTD